MKVPINHVVRLEIVVINETTVVYHVFRGPSEQTVLDTTNDVWAIVVKRKQFS